MQSEQSGIEIDSAHTAGQAGCKASCAATIALAISALFVPLTATADVFGVYAGGAVWSQSIEGDAAASANNVANALDLEQDLGFDDKRQLQLYAGIEHPIPLLPNVRLDYSEIAQQADGLLTRQIEFNGRSFSLDANLRSEVDITQTDLVLYYEILDNDLVAIDLGIGARYLDGFVRITDETGFSSAEFTGVIPLAYAGARVDLPFSNFWAGAQVRGISYQKDSLIDARGALGWESDFGLGIEAGYRHMELDIDEFDDVDAAELTISGPFAGLTFSF